MKTKIITKTVLLSALVAVFFLSGCVRNYLVPEPGAIAREDARIDFPEAGLSNVSWQGKDLDIQYSIANNNGELLISGKIIIHDNVLNSFPILDRLVVKITFLDKQGSVIGTTDITPSYSTKSQVTGPLSFKSTAALPLGTSSLAFNYFGTIFSNPNESSDTWEIFYFPFN